jgi:hypothetical protein
MISPALCGKHFFTLPRTCPLAAAYATILSPTMEMIRQNALCIFNSAYIRALCLCSPELALSRCFCIHNRVSVDSAVLISPANAAHASACSQAPPASGECIPPANGKACCQSACLLPAPAALPDFASALPSAVVFSASAEMKEKIKPRKRDRRNHHENVQKFNSQHIQQERK